MKSNWKHQGEVEMGKGRKVQGAKVAEGLPGSNTKRMKERRGKNAVFDAQ